MSYPLRRSPALFGGSWGLVLALPVALHLFAAAAACQLVTGRVVDAGNGEPIDGALVSLVDTLASTERDVLSNADGEFLVAAPTPGTYLLRAGRLGYALAETTPIEVGDGEVVEVELRLDVEAIELEPLTVVVRRRETQREHDLREFYKRAVLYNEPHFGAIQIYTRQSLAPWDAYSLAEALRIQFRWIPNCTPKVFLDGKQQTGPFLQDLMQRSLSNFEGVEFYTGGGPSTGRFWDPNGCGVVLVWTRALPESGRSLSTAEIVMLLGAAALLVGSVFLAF